MLNQESKKVPSLLRCSTCCVPFHPVSHPNFPVSPSLSAVAAEAPIKPHDVVFFVFFGWQIQGIFFVFEKSHLIKHLHCVFFLMFVVFFWRLNKQERWCRCCHLWVFRGDTRETKKYLLPSGNLTWQWNIPIFNRKYILKGLC